MTIKELQEDLAEVLVERTVQEWACILSEDATSLRSATSTSEQEVAAGERRRWISEIAWVLER